MLRYDGNKTRIESNQNNQNPSQSHHLFQPYLINVSFVFSVMNKKKSIHYIKSRDHGLRPLKKVLGCNYYHI